MVRKNKKKQNRSMGLIWDNNIREKIQFSDSVSGTNTFEVVNLLDLTAIVEGMKAQNGKTPVFKDYTVKSEVAHQSNGALTVDYLIMLVDGATTIAEGETTGTNLNTAIATIEGAKDYSFRILKTVSVPIRWFQLTSADAQDFMRFSSNSFNIGNWMNKIAKIVDTPSSEHAPKVYFCCVYNVEGSDTDLIEQILSISGAYRYEMSQSSSLSI